MTTSLQSSKKSHHFLRWVIWYLAISFYFYEFFLRVSPSVMIDSLKAAFNVDDEVIGAVSSVYFYIYAPMQFPVGLLMDRFGARKLLSAAASVCGLGALAFGAAMNIEFLAIGRFLMGLGSAFAFVGALYITSHWFPRTKIALLIGIANSVAMAGAVAGEGPVSILEGWLGWRYSMFVIGGLGILLAIFIFFVVHNAPKGVNDRRKGNLLEVWKGLMTILVHSQSWLNAAIAVFLYATTTAFAALWGVPFLMRNHHMSQDVAGFASSSIYAGWIIGGPLIGYLSDRFKKRRLFMKICSLFAGLSLTPVILFTDLPPALIFILLPLVGIFSAAELLNFSHAIDLHPPEATGSAVAFTNFVIMMGGAVFQPFVGWLLDVFWSGGFTGTVKDYSYADYKLAMICFPLCFFIAFLLSFFLKEGGDRKKGLPLF